MGMSHGSVCAGCCLGLMAILFALGIMNLAWMAVVAAVMTLEKLLPSGLALGRGAGVITMSAGIASLLLPAVSSRLFEI